jgi:predicted DNA-binding protein
LALVEAIESGMTLRAAAAALNVAPATAHRWWHRWRGQARRRAGSMPYVVPYTVFMRKTSIYLDDEQADRLARLARAEGRPQAEIVRDAISCYRPAPKRDRNFALAGNFERIDSDSRPISEIPEDELMRGFGE